LKGGKALLNVVGRRRLGDLLYEDLPEIARDAYECLKKNSPEAQREALERIVQASNQEIVQEAEKISLEVMAERAEGSPEIPPVQVDEVCQVIVDYLTQVPAAVRRSFSRAEDPTGTTVTREMLPRSEEEILQLLP